MLIRFTLASGDSAYINASQIVSIQAVSPKETRIRTSDGQLFAVRYDVHEVAQVVETHLAEYVHPEKRLDQWHLDEPAENA